MHAAMAALPAFAFQTVTASDWAVETTRVWAAPSPSSNAAWAGEAPSTTARATVRTVIFLRIASLLLLV